MDGDGSGWIIAGASMKARGSAFERQLK